MKTRLFPGGRSKSARFGAAALVLMSMVAVSYYESREYSRAVVEAAQTQSTGETVNQLVASLVDAESGERGFLLTGEGRYLEPYNHALQAIPQQLDQLKNLLAAHPGESAHFTRLNDLINQKFSEMRQTIELRRSGGAQAATTLVLTGEGKRTMEDIREVGAAIRQGENSAQRQALTKREAASQVVLLATVAGSIVLLFLFAFGMEPFASTDPVAKQRSALFRYGVATLAVVVTVLLRMALTPLVGPTTIPFTFFFPAAWFAAWYGGLRAGALSVALSALAGDYFFAEPAGSFLIGRRDDQVAVLIFVLIGFGMALLSESQHRAVTQAEAAQKAERHERLRFETTLASIGDAVIATDREGRVTFVNKIALSLLKAGEAGLLGRPLDDVFRIVNELTRAPVQSPVARALQEGKVEGLANQTVLVAQDGSEIPIADSAAPIRDAQGELIGVVLVFRDITEKRKSEKAAAASAAELRQVMNTAAVGLTRYSRDLRYLAANPAYAEVTGVPLEQIIGKSMVEMVGAEGWKKLEPYVERVLRGERVEFDLSIEYPRRGPRHLHAVYSPERDASDQVVGWVASLMDVTDRRRAEEAQRQSELFADRVLQGITDGFVALDREWRFTHVNAEAERLNGIPRDRLLGKNIWELFPPMRGTNVEQELRRVASLGEPVEFDNHFQAIHRWFHIKAYPTQEGGLSIFYQDITARKRSEEELRRSAEEIQALVDATPALVWIARDPECQWIIGNQAANKLMGVAQGTNVSPTPAEGDAIPFRHFRLDGSALRPRELPIQITAATGAPVNDFEYEFCQEGGKRIRLFGNAAPLFDANGKVRGAVGTFLDITDRKRAEEAQRQSELAAGLVRAHDEERRRIGRDLHDTAVQTLVLLKMRLDVLQASDELAQSARQKLAESIRLANEAIQQVRTTSYALYPPMLEEEGLKSAIPHFLDGFMERSGIETRFEFPDHFERPPRDVELATFRVLQESLTNVLRHSGSATVQVRVELNDGMLCLEVRDQGKGLAPETLKAYNQGTFTKLGVGLRSMSERVRQLGGSLKISSSSEGTVVRAEVPRQKSS